ncbi:putative tetratricopeptide-like helical domain, DYW domain-containing protein [Rosa chinensis]|uniref:Putative tetratricopeptide-like helical domain, DYW domain-containing protein n=1 Tax=Rosa chinensis TaxID=74649 RepID=A0A2P6S3J4_ROSCH|nr:pentatricopeptide repeat-containing protein At3g02330, mitochondrial [Rosa chinensis]PRQ53236.1 putative tetratricopeptide-like helical domain, DYW domain-containing protein [Rosa chinensis]
MATPHHHLLHTCLTRLFSFPLKPLSPKPQPLFFTFSTLTRPNQTTPTTNFKTFSQIFQQCSHARALNPGKQAHARMLVSGFEPTVFVTNCLIQMYVKCWVLGYAAKVFDEMPQRDTVSWNTMIFGYAESGEMGSAQACFDAMPERDVVSWNSLISGYLQNGECLKSIDVYLKMGNAGVGCDRTTSAVVLKACAVMEEVELGIQIHCVAVKMAFDIDVFTGSALADMYGKCKRLDCSLQVFRELPEKNSVSWSAVIAGSVQNDRFAMGIELFNEMQKAGIGVSQSTYASVFRSCAGLSAYSLGTQLHGHAVKTQFHSDVVVGTATLDMYAKCDNVGDARKIFNSMPNRSLQSYNAMIVGYARNGQGFEALQLFMLLQKSGIGFDEITLSGALSACAMIKGHLEGLQLQGLVVKSSFRSNVCVTNAILDMYGKCGDVLGASFVFDEMVRRDAVSWNAIIAAHGQNENKEETLSCFVSMLRSRMEPDEFTYGSVLRACAGQHSLNHGMEIHSRIIKSGMGMNLFIGGALVDMYSKCGMMEEAEKIHHRTEHTMVSWNAIISGFSLLKQNEDAQTFFSQMLEMGEKPDNFTYATVLDTCANLATVGLGKQIHAQIIKHELQSDVYVTSTLVDMYAKCGNMQDSHLMFKKAPKRDAVTWNAMISGYANYGLGEDALRIFDNMQLENVEPNHVTFVSVLRACGHIGNAEKGLYYFRTMLSDYGLKPQLEHYSCMVDIIGRSGQVDQALRLIQDMPFEPDDVIWRTLLSICKLHGNVQVAEIAANSIWQLDPQDSSTYVLLSNIYAEAGMWGEVLEMRKTMRYNRMKKEPGCSWIEVKDEVHAFFVGDKAHPRSEEVYERLDLLVVEMMRIGYRPEIEFVLDEEMEEQEHLE